MDLQVNVAQLLKERAGARRNLELEDGLLDQDGGAPAHVSGSLVLTRTDRGIWVSGTVALSAEATCARCLTSFTHTAQVAMDDVFLPTVDLATGALVRGDAEGDEDVQAIDDRHNLDLSEPLRQYLVASTPLAPVCKEDCRGICPECGTDLNESTCACHAYEDARWTKLKELLR